MTTGWCALLALKKPISLLLEHLPVLLLNVPRCRGNFWSSLVVRAGGPRWSKLWTGSDAEPDSYLVPFIIFHFQLFIFRFLLNLLLDIVLQLIYFECERSFIQIELDCILEAVHASRKLQRVIGDMHVGRAG